MDKDINGENSLSGTVAGVHRIWYMLTDPILKVNQFGFTEMYQFGPSRKHITLENLTERIFLQVMEMLKVWATQRLQQILNVGVFACFVRQRWTIEGKNAELH